MNNHNLYIANGDTDSLLFYKASGEEFKEEERNTLLDELNSVCPKGLLWEKDGYYKTVIILRAKNYVLFDGETSVIKGSALKASTKSQRMKTFIKDIIQNILEDKQDYVRIYEKYVKEVSQIKTKEEIKEWSARKTISEKVLTGTRKNETNVADAIIGTELVAGDRCFMFYRDNGTLCLAEQFNGDYSKDKLLQQCFDTCKIFSSVLDMRPILNYKLKKNKKLLALL